MTGLSLKLAFPASSSGDRVRSARKGHVAIDADCQVILKKAVAAAVRITARATGVARVTRVIYHLSQREARPDWAPEEQLLGRCEGAEAKSS